MADSDSEQVGSEKEQGKPWEASHVWAELAGQRVAAGLQLLQQGGRDGDVVAPARACTTHMMT